MLLKMEVTKRAEFSCCYIQDNRIEAHHCKVEVTVVGPQRFEDFGRVISYETLQFYLSNILPNHTFLYNESDKPSVQVAKAFQKAKCSTKSCDFEISAENLCKHFAEKLQEILDRREPGVTIVNLKLREDNNSYVSWSKDYM